jgi:DNA replication licensing factor MCM4
MDTDVDMDNDRPLGFPSSARTFSAVATSQIDADAQEDDDQGLVKFIWGTTVKIQETMNLFTDFLRNFKPKYRASYNTALANVAIEAGEQPAPSMSLYDNLSTQKANEKLYERYLRTMRDTTQTCLNLDALNLLAYPPTKKLYYQLLAYPQEVVPIMDQVLHDTMVDLGEEDLETVRREKGDDSFEAQLLEDVVLDIEQMVYKIRPFGGDKTVNMRDLNPGGESVFVNNLDDN